MNILLPSILTAGSVFLFALWYLRSKNTQEVRIRSLAEPHRMVVERQDPFTQRVAFPVVDSAVNFLLAILPTSLITRARKWLTTAGDRTSLAQFMTIVLVTSTALPAAYFAVVWIAADGVPSTLALLPVIGFAVAGLFVPFMILRRMAKNRQKTVWRSMPNAIDLLTTCVEAGLSLDFGLQRVADRYQGPLSDEIHRVLREVGLGKTRRDALVDMAERVDLPDLMTFVNSIVQAESLGTSVGQVLRVQAQQMRMRRRQRAEQIARQAPVKMVFPLVLFLMPSLFIVTIGPVVLNVIRAFSEN
ncbi:MAG TPA: type II secretion system F family protein [Dehalococcoidia bacterium]|jgi:tight adherence protein C